MSSDVPRLVVLFSGGGRTLENLAEKISQGELHAQITLAIASRQDLGGIEKAAAWDIPTRVIDPEDQDALWKAIRGERPDAVIMAGYVHLLLIPSDFKNRVLNIHPALLPKYGGKGFYGSRVHEAVIAAGEKVSGCTVHYANEAYDAGPIILHSKEVAVLLDDTPGTLAARVFEQECITYPKAIQKHFEIID